MLDLFLYRYFVGLNLNPMLNLKLTFIEKEKPELSVSVEQLIKGLDLHQEKKIGSEYDVLMSLINRRWTERGIFFLIIPKCLHESKSGNAKRHLSLHGGKTKRNKNK